MGKIYYTTPEAAEFLGLSVWTLIKWRSLRKGVTWVKHGGKVLYRAADLQLFSRTGEMQPSGAAGMPAASTDTRND